MINPAVRSAEAIPATLSRPRRPFFEKLIDNKVSQAAVRVFECIKRTISSFFDSLYNKFYAAYRHCFRVNEKKSTETPSPATELARPIEIVHGQEGLNHIGGAPICSKDTKHIISVMQDPQAGPGEQREVISINYIPIHFSADIGEDLSFGTAHGTRNIVVADIPSLPGWVRITETETNGNQKVWRVNTEAPIKEFLSLGDLQQIVVGHHYVAQEIIASSEDI